MILSESFRRPPPSHLSWTQAKAVSSEEPPHSTKTSFDFQAWYLQFSARFLPMLVGKTFVPASPSPGQADVWCYRSASSLERYDSQARLFHKSSTPPCCWL